MDRERNHRNAITVALWGSVIASPPNKYIRLTLKGSKTGTMSVEEQLSHILAKLDEHSSVLAELREGVKEPIQEWYSTNEVAELAGKTPASIRYWCNMGQIDFDQVAPSEPIRISAETVDKLRENKWKPLRKVSYDSLPPSKKARSSCSPSQSVA